MTDLLLLPQPTGRDLRSARKLVGLSQAAAARRVGYSLRGWQDAEYGHSRLHAATWTLFLLSTGQHGSYTLLMRIIPINQPQDAK